MNHATIQHSAFHHHYKVLASDLNQYGIMHGGRLLTLCDEAGYISARNHAHCDCLTRAVHQARFHRAVQEGEDLTIRARVGYTGHSSLWVFVEVISTADAVCVIDAVFVFAAIDEHLNGCHVPAVHAESKDDIQLQARLKSMRDQVLVQNSLQ